MYLEDSQLKVSRQLKVNSGGAKQPHKNAFNTCLFMLGYNLYMFLFSGDRGALQEHLLNLTYTTTLVMKYTVVITGECH